MEIEDSIDISRRANTLIAMLSKTVSFITTQVGQSFELSSLNGTQALRKSIIIITNHQFINISKHMHRTH